LRRGVIIWKNAEPILDGLLVFSRLDRSTGQEIVVVINPGLSSIVAAPIQLEGSAPNQVYVNLLNPSDTATSQHGKVLFDFCAPRKHHTIQRGSGMFSLS
jgi:hypothetical protein